MLEIPELCMCCMTVLDENGVCPECGNTEEVIQPSPYLPLKTVIGAKYIIGMEKKKNSEGITYAAYDAFRMMSVSVREFYPDALAVRSDKNNLDVLPFNNQRSRYIGCMNSFRSLWTSLQGMKGLPALINVYDVLMENGTVYAVYEEPERVSLRDFLLQSDDGYMPWEQAKILFTPVFETVIALNSAGIIHRGISPSSLIVGNDGTLKLTNFCIMQARSEGSVLHPELFEGYAAYEQYDSPAGHGTYTDVYALASSLYRVLTGVMPLNALSRAQEDLMMFPAFFIDIIPTNVIEGIIAAMEIYPDERLKTVSALCEKLDIQVKNSPTPPPATANPQPPIPTEHRPVQKAVRPGATVGAYGTSVNTPPVRPAARAQQPQQAAKPQKAVKEKTTTKTAALIIILVLVLILLLIGIVLTVKGIIETSAASAMIAGNIETLKLTGLQFTSI